MEGGNLCFSGVVFEKNSANSVVCAKDHACPKKLTCSNSDIGHTCDCVKNYGNCTLR